MSNKECPRCEESKTLDNFTSGRSLCKNCRRLQKLDYRNRNREKVRSTQRAWATSEKGRRSRKTSKVLRHSKYPHIKVAEKAKARAKKINKNVAPNWADSKKIKNVYKGSKSLEKITGLKYHVDHIVPLNHPNVCGLHVWANLQVLEASLNEEKGNELDYVLKIL